MTSENEWKFAVWERLNKKGKWCPFSSDVSNFLEKNWRKNSEIACLGDADDKLKIYTIHLKEFIQTSSITGTKSKVRRQLYDCVDSLSNGFTWEWSDKQDSWQIYDVEVSDFLEKAFLQGVRAVTLNKTFHGYHYEIDFSKMLQINKRSKRKRPIRRLQSVSPYPVVRNDEDILPTAPAENVPETENGERNYPNISVEVPGTTALESQVNQYMLNVQRGFGPNSFSSVASAVGPCNPDAVHTLQNDTSENQKAASDLHALVNGYPWYDSKPPHTPQSKLRPVPGIEPVPSTVIKPSRKKKVKHVHNIENNDSVLEEHANEIALETLTNPSEQVCIICYESLLSGSTYDGDSKVLQLKLCSHMFHKACLAAMYNSGPKDRCLQCPVCKAIHGEKLGIQPPGSMVYHVIPYSLPGYHNCDTIRIIYDIPSGTQGPEHPNPGKKYTARGFPRHCFLPDNEIGRKVLRLLLKAWKRRLIFTIGRSSTTSEENTVTWNEIHHKTEFGCSRRGHGYPDDNYFSNVIAELEAQGVKDDDVFNW